MKKEVWIFTGIAVAFLATSIGLSQYNTSKERALREKEAENKKLYYSKLTPEQVEKLEKDKLEVKRAQIELDRAIAEKNKSELELKKTVTDFKEDITNDLRREVQQNIDKDMRRTFDSWSAKFEDRLDGKVDRVVERIDKLSDKYGGVKEASSNSTPSIQVVNAPNN